MGLGEFQGDFEETGGSGLDPAASYDMEVYLTQPGGVRQRAQLQNIRPGIAKRLNTSFVVPLGAEPRTVYAGARIRGEPWFSNVAIELPARR